MYKPQNNGKMSLEQTACEDLKAFERRLTEVIDCLQPATQRWRILLAIITICTAIGAYYWLTDPHTSDVSFHQSLINHPFFTTSSLMLPGLFGHACLSHTCTLVWASRSEVIFRLELQRNKGSVDFYIVILFMTGIHKKVIAPSIITARTRMVLTDFNMSCDDTGKLILKPRPAIQQVSVS